MEAIARRGARIVPVQSRRLMRTYSDERLVGLVRAGTDTAFEVLYDRHAAGVLSFCRHMLGSQDEAEEALQQTLLAAHRDLLRHDREIAFRPWLYAIARNSCLASIRSRRADGREDGLEGLPATSGLADVVQRRADLRELVTDVAALPESQRAALVLTELGDLSHGEVAAVIGCAEPKVRALVYQARSALIAARNARNTPCEEIRAEISVLRGGGLRRTKLRAHVAGCPPCAAFAADVKSQRRALALALPVLPGVGLKRTVLAAVLGGGVAGGGAAGGGGLIASGALAKLAATALAGSAVAGGITVAELDHHQHVAHRAAHPHALLADAHPRRNERATRGTPRVVAAVAMTAPARGLGTAGGGSHAVPRHRVTHVYRSVPHRARTGARLERAAPHGTAPKHVVVSPAGTGPQVSAPPPVVPKAPEAGGGKAEHPNTGRGGGGGGGHAKDPRGSAHDAHGGDHGGGARGGAQSGRQSPSAPGGGKHHGQNGQQGQSGPGRGTRHGRVGQQGQSGQHGQRGHGGGADHGHDGQQGHGGQGGGAHGGHGGGHGHHGH